MNYDSKEELYFSWWLDELKEAKYIVEWYPGSTIELSKEVEVGGKKLLNKHGYAFDFSIRWNDSAKDVFITSEPKKGFFTYNKFIIDPSLDDSGYIPFSYIEIKGVFDARNMTRLFVINQKWVYDKRRIYVQLVKIPKLFKDTFTPAKYLITDAGKQERKLNFVPKTLDEYVKYIRERVPKTRKR